MDDHSFCDICGWTGKDVIWVRSCGLDICGRCRFKNAMDLLHNETRRNTELRQAVAMCMIDHAEKMEPGPGIMKMSAEVDQTKKDLILLPVPEKIRDIDIQNRKFQKLFMAQEKIRAEISQVIHDRAYKCRREQLIKNLSDNPEILDGENLRSELAVDYEVYCCFGCKLPLIYTGDRKNTTKAQKKNSVHGRTCIECTGKVVVPEELKKPKVSQEVTRYLRQIPGL